MIKWKKGAFTLVELIVVITILAVLATIWYVSYAWYASSARDSARLYDMSSIVKALELFKTINTTVPDPEDKVDMKISWTTFWHQWDLWEQITNQIWFSSAPIDPKDKQKYSYFVSSDGGRYQVVWFMENESWPVWVLNNQSFAQDLTKRFPISKWHFLWLTLQQDNLPIHRNTNVVNNVEFDYLSGSLASTFIRPIFDNEVQEYYGAFMAAWKVHATSTYRWVLSQKDCPENFIHVPWDDRVWQPAFCIWKYEASYETPWNTSSSRLITQSWVAPATEIPFNTGLPGCEANGDWYHTMTFNQWLTIARNIEQQWQNWSGWSVWNWFIKTWNSGNMATGISQWWSTALANIINTWTNGNSSDDATRQLVLSNGEIIWDFIWNIWEVVLPVGVIDDNILASHEIIALNSWPLNDLMRTYDFELWNTSVHLWENITNDRLKNLYWPIGDYSQWQWIWWVRQLQVNSFYIVWWDAYEASADENWLYAFWNLQYATDVNVWTRCAYMNR